MAGKYFTPKGIREIIDPCCGSGAFLLQVKPKDEKAGPSDVIFANPPFDTGPSKGSGTA